MRLLYRLLVSIIYCEIFVYCQRGSSSGIKGSQLGTSGSGSVNFGGGNNGNSKVCKNGPCKYTEVIVLGAFGGMAGIMSCLSLICFCYKRQQRRFAHRNSILIETKKKTNKKCTIYDNSIFKSGSWSNRYLQFGVWNGPDCCSLSFDSISFKITGSGSDNVGIFTISGSYSNENGRIVLVKRYQLGTGDPLGNLGHRVLIRLAWNSETQKFEGNWYVRTKAYCGADQYELTYNDEPEVWAISTPQ